MRIYRASLASLNVIAALLQLSLAPHKDPVPHTAMHAMSLTERFLLTSCENSDSVQMGLL